MTSTRELVDRLNVSTAEWVNAIGKISEDAFNSKQAQAWSPSQIFMHLILTESGIRSILTGPSETVGESRTLLLERVERGLTNYDKKLAAPATLEPRPDAYDKNRLIQKFVNNRNALVEILEHSPELENLFTAYPHPYFGLLTGVEWLHNVVLHANRHFRQLERAVSA